MFTRISSCVSQVCHKMSTASKDILLAHVQEYKDTQKKLEDSAFADFCKNAVSEAINNAKLGQRRYVAVVHFVCTLSKQTMEATFKQLFPRCSIEACIKTHHDEKVVYQVKIEW